MLEIAIIGLCATALIDLLLTWQINRDVQRILNMMPLENTIVDDIKSGIGKIINILTKGIRK